MSRATAARFVSSATAAAISAVHAASASASRADCGGASAGGSGRERGRHGPDCACASRGGPRLGALSLLGAAAAFPPGTFPPPCAAPDAGPRRAARALASSARCSRALALG